MIDFYKKGHRERGQRIHAEVRNHFSRALALCENYKLMHSNAILMAVDSSHAEARRLRLAAVGAMVISFILAAALAFTLAIQVLRPLRLNDAQMEDFDVISEEIRHIDTIVQNFLEFSRPPKLKVEPISPSTIIDQTLLLLVHRLKSYDVDVKVARERSLPEIEADPEIHGRLTQPFFTAKENGTGLGLNIAKRIVEEHRGTIRVESEPGRGATFIVTLPFRESSDEPNSGNR